MIDEANAFHDWREWRRLRAWHLGQQGWTQRAIAAALGASDGAVSHWLRSAAAEGPEALKAQASPGRPPKLSREQRGLIPDFLWHGAEAYGFRGELWTCPRIVRVLRREFGVPYSPSQVSRLLRELHWTPQTPLKQAFQRDDQAVRAWSGQVWPELCGQARRERKTLVFVDESGFYLLPAVVKTYAPQALTPILREWQTRDHLSVMAGLTPQGRIYSMVRTESLGGLHTIAFLTHLLRVAGPRLLVIWDGSPIHRSAEVKNFLARGAGRKIHLERLPPYAPDLNPTEWLWRQLKDVEMANQACLDLEELHMEFHLALGRVIHKPRLVPSFFAGAGLSL